MLHSTLISSYTLNISISTEGFYVRETHRMNQLMIHHEYFTNRVQLFKYFLNISLRFSEKARRVVTFDLEVLQTLIRIPVAWRII